jgi:hypothetical protein
MALQEIPELLQEDGGISLLGERPVHVIVDQHDQADLGGEIEDPVQGRVGGARDVPLDLGGHELLVDRELPDSREDAREGLERAPDAAYMSDGLKPVIMGSKRAWSVLGSELYAVAIAASVNE